MTDVVNKGSADESEEKQTAVVNNCKIKDEPKCFNFFFLRSLSER